MAKTKRVSRKPFYTILIISLLLSIAYVGFRYLYQPKSSQIMEISPQASFVYGNTILSGTLQKDSPAGQQGNYILVLSDLRVVVLDIPEADLLLGKMVTAEGDLVPSVPITNPPKLLVKTIYTAK